MEGRISGFREGYPSSRYDQDRQNIRVQDIIKVGRMSGFYI